jgi:hypothetical protein
MQRELRALPHRAAKDQQASQGRHSWPRGGRVLNSGLQLIKRDRAERGPNEDDAQDESKVTKPIS